VTGAATCRCACAPGPRGSIAAQIIATQIAALRIFGLHLMITAEHTAPRRHDGKPGRPLEGGPFHA
jgi:hypothetical protein